MNVNYNYINSILYSVVFIILKIRESADACLYRVTRYRRGLSVENLWNDRCFHVGLYTFKFELAIIKNAPRNEMAIDSKI